MATSDYVESDFKSFSTFLPSIPSQKTPITNIRSIAYNGTNWIAVGSDSLQTRTFYSYSDVFTQLEYARVMNASLKSISAFRQTLINANNPSLYSNAITALNTEYTSKLNSYKSMLSAAAAKFKNLKSLGYNTQPQSIKTLHTMMISSNGFDWNIIEDNPFQFYNRSLLSGEITDSNNMSSPYFNLSLVNDIKWNSTLKLWVAVGNGKSLWTGGPGYSQYAIGGVADPQQWSVNITVTAFSSVPSADGIQTISYVPQYYSPVEKGVVVTITGASNTLNNLSNVTILSATTNTNPLTFTVYNPTGVVGTSQSATGVASTNRNNPVFSYYGRNDQADNNGQNIGPASGSLFAPRTTIATSPDGLVWTSRGMPNLGGNVNSVYAINRATKVACSATRTIVLGEFSTDYEVYEYMASSPDCINWSIIPKATSNLNILPKGIAYNGALWVIVGDRVSGGNNRDYIQTSTNGTTWTARFTVPFNSNSDYMLRDVAWNGSKWLAVGSRSTSITEFVILSSNDGFTWSVIKAIDTGNSSGFDCSIAFDGNLWMIATGFKDYSTPDGINLTELNNNISGTAIATKIPLPILGGTISTVRSLLAGFGKPMSILRSYDNADWIPQLIDEQGVNFLGAPQKEFYGVARCGTFWIVVGNPQDGYTGRSIATSTDGFTWTFPTTIASGLYTPIISSGRGVAWDGSTVIVVGHGNIQISTSTDGISWTNYTSPLNNCNAVAWNGRNINVGISSFAATSSGTQVITVTSTTGIVTGQYITIVNATNPKNNGTFLVTAVGTGTITCNNTIGVSASETSSVTRMHTGLWIIGGNGGLAISVNKTTWTKIVCPLNIVYNIAWNGYIWVAVGSGVEESIIISVDGVRWYSTNPLTQPFTECRAVAWNRRLWVAVGSGNNTIATSIDGYTWNPLGMNVFNSVGTMIAWDDTKWIAGGIGSFPLASSLNGTTWASYDTSLSNVYSYANDTIALPYTGASTPAIENSINAVVANIGNSTRITAAAEQVIIQTQLDVEAAAAAAAAAVTLRNVTKSTAAYSVIKFLYWKKTITDQFTLLLNGPVGNGKFGLYNIQLADNIDTRLLFLQAKTLYDTMNASNTDILNFYTNILNDNNPQSVLDGNLSSILLTTLNYTTQLIDFYENARVLYNATVNGLSAFYNGYNFDALLTTYGLTSSTPTTKSTVLSAWNGNLSSMNSAKTNANTVFETPVTSATYAITNSNASLVGITDLTTTIGGLNFNITSFSAPDGNGIQTITGTNINVYVGYTVTIVSASNSVNQGTRTVLSINGNTFTVSNPSGVASSLGAAATGPFVPVLSQISTNAPNLLSTYNTFVTATNSLFFFYASFYQTYNYKEQADKYKSDAITVATKWSTVIDPGSVPITSFSAPSNGIQTITVLAIGSLTIGRGIIISGSPNSSNNVTRTVLGISGNTFTVSNSSGVAYTATSLSITSFSAPSNGIQTITVSSIGTLVVGRDIVISGSPSTTNNVTRTVLGISGNTFTILNYSGVAYTAIVGDTITAKDAIIGKFGTIMVPLAEINNTFDPLFTTYYLTLTNNVPTYTTNKPLKYFKIAYTKFARPYAYFSHLNTLYLDLKAGLDNLDAVKTNAINYAKDQISLVRIEEDYFNSVTRRKSQVNLSTVTHLNKLLSLSFYDDSTYKLAFNFSQKILLGSLIYPYLYPLIAAIDNAIAVAEDDGATPPQTGWGGATQIVTTLQRPSFTIRNSTGVAYTATNTDEIKGTVTIGKALSFGKPDSQNFQTVTLSSENIDYINFDNLQPGNVVTISGATNSANNITGSINIVSYPLPLGTVKINLISATNNPSVQKITVDNIGLITVGSFFEIRSPKDGDNRTTQRVTNIVGNTLFIVNPSGVSTSVDSRGSTETAIGIYYSSSAVFKFIIYNALGVESITEETALVKFSVKLTAFSAPSNGLQTVSIDTIKQFRLKGYPVTITGAPNNENNKTLQCITQAATVQQALPVPNYNGPNGWVYVPGAGQGLSGFQYVNEVSYAFQKLANFQRSYSGGGNISFNQNINITITGASNSVNNVTQPISSYFASSFTVYNPNGVAATNQTAIGSCTFTITTFSAPSGGIQTITANTIGVQKGQLVSISGSSVSNNNVSNKEVIGINGYTFTISNPFGEAASQQTATGTSAIQISSFGSPDGNGSQLITLTTNEIFRISGVSASIKSTWKEFMDFSNNVTYDTFASQINSFDTAVNTVSINNEFTQSFIDDKRVADTTAIAAQYVTAGTLHLNNVVNNVNKQIPARFTLTITGFSAPSNGIQTITTSGIGSLQVNRGVTITGASNTANNVVCFVVLSITGNTFTISNSSGVTGSNQTATGEYGPLVDFGSVTYEGSSTLTELVNLLTTSYNSLLALRDTGLTQSNIDTTITSFSAPVKEFPLLQWNIPSIQTVTVSSIGNIVQKLTVRITGASNSGNNGIFKIISVSGNTFTIRNRSGVAASSQSANAKYSTVDRTLVTAETYASTIESVQISTAYKTIFKLIPLYYTTFDNALNLVTMMTSNLERWKKMKQVAISTSPYIVGYTHGFEGDPFIMSIPPTETSYWTEINGTPFIDLDTDTRMYATFNNGVCTTIPPYDINMVVEYSPTTEYVLNTLVKYNSNIYQCIKDNTDYTVTGIKGVDPSSSVNWMKVTHPDVIDFNGDVIEGSPENLSLLISKNFSEYVSTAKYSYGDMVTKLGVVYRCIYDFTKIKEIINIPPPPTSSDISNYWIRRQWPVVLYNGARIEANPANFPILTTIENNYNISKPYNGGDIVRYENLYYYMSDPSRPRTGVSPLSAPWVATTRAPVYTGYNVSTGKNVNVGSTLVDRWIECNTTNFLQLDYQDFPTYSSTTTYKLGDFVSHNNNIYECAIQIPFVSSIDVTNSKYWSISKYPTVTYKGKEIECTPGSIPLLFPGDYPEYNPTTVYKINDKVSFNTVYFYKCILDTPKEIPIKNIPPTATTNWQLRPYPTVLVNDIEVDGNPASGNFVELKDVDFHMYENNWMYYQGDIVSYNGKVYECTNANYSNVTYPDSLTGKSPITDSGYWADITTDNYVNDKYYKPNNIVPWDPINSRSYDVGALVVWKGYIYRCVTAVSYKAVIDLNDPIDLNFVISYAPSINETIWQLVDLRYPENWDPVNTTSYGVGSLISWNRITYKCIAAVTYPTGLDLTKDEDARTVRQADPSINQQYWQLIINSTPDFNPRMVELYSNTKTYYVGQEVMINNFAEDEDIMTSIISPFRVKIFKLERYTLYQPVQYKKPTFGVTNELDSDGLYKTVVDRGNWNTYGLPRYGEPDDDPFNLPYFASDLKRRVAQTVIFPYSHIKDNALVFNDLISYSAWRNMSIDSIFNRIDLGLVQQGIYVSYDFTALSVKPPFASSLYNQIVAKGNAMISEFNALETAYPIKRVLKGVYENILTAIGEYTTQVAIYQQKIIDMKQAYFDLQYRRIIKDPYKYLNVVGLAQNPPQKYWRDLGVGDIEDLTYNLDVKRDHINYSNAERDIYYEQSALLEEYESYREQKLIRAKWLVNYPQMFSYQFGHFDSEIILPIDYYRQPFINIIRSAHIFIGMFILGDNELEYRGMLGPSGYFTNNTQQDNVAGLINTAILQSVRPPEYMIKGSETGAAVFGIDVLTYEIKDQNFKNFSMIPKGLVGLLASTFQSVYDPTQVLGAIEFIGNLANNGGKVDGQVDTSTEAGARYAANMSVMPRISWPGFSDRATSIPAVKQQIAIYRNSLVNSEPEPNELNRLGEFFTTVSKLLYLCSDQFDDFKEGLIKDITLRDLPGRVPITTPGRPRIINIPPTGELPKDIVKDPKPVKTTRTKALIAYEELLEQYNELKALDKRIRNRIKTLNKLPPELGPLVAVPEAIKRRQIVKKFNESPAPFDPQFAVDDNAVRQRFIGFSPPKTGPRDYSGVKVGGPIKPNTNPANLNADILNGAAIAEAEAKNLAVQNAYEEAMVEYRQSEALKAANIEFLKNVKVNRKRAKEAIRDIELQNKAIAAENDANIKRYLEDVQAWKDEKAARRAAYALERAKYRKSVLDRRLAVDAVETAYEKLLDLAKQQRVKDVKLAYEGTTAILTYKNVVYQQALLQNTAFSAYVRSNFLPATVTDLQYFQIVDPLEVNALNMEQRGYRRVVFTVTNYTGLTRTYDRFVKARANILPRTKIIPRAVQEALGGKKGMMTMAALEIVGIGLTAWQMGAFNYDESFES